MLTIRLIGPPAIERDSRPAPPPRGRKSWALLGYLFLTERPPSRSHLAELLFSAADDPLGALRWTLAELRRALAVPNVLHGDPIVLSRNTDQVHVDLDILTRESTDPLPLLDLTGELLEGLHLPANPEFESWLVVQRHRVSALVEARLRQAAMSLLAADRANDAIAYAALAVARNPLEEGNHELLARNLAQAGDRNAALRQIAVCEDLLRRELGIGPSPALREAVPNSRTAPRTAPRTATPTLATPTPTPTAATATAHLEAGRAALAAGAVDSGLRCLRRAAAESARCADDTLRARALAALGGALVHSVRGHDEEGALILHQAALLAEHTGERATSVLVHRELGFVEVQAGRRVTAATWLAKATAAAETDAEFAAILGVRGMNASDQGDYPAAFAHLAASAERAARCTDHRQRAWSLSLLARAHLLRGEHSQAADLLTHCLTMVREQRWIAFLPWPQALNAELDLRSGRFEAAAEGFEQAWTLACRLDDPCWEGMAARGLGLLAASRGDRPAATRWLAEALHRAVRIPDRYQWVHGCVLDTMAAVALHHEERKPAGTFAEELAELAAHCDMREFVVRAHLHRYRLGERPALASARMLAARIDNPALARLLAESRPRRASAGRLLPGDYLSPDPPAAWTT